MAITRGQDGSIYVIDEVADFSGKATTEDPGTAIYQIDDTDMRVWSPNHAITVSTGVISVDWMDNGIDYFSGRFKLTASGLEPTVSGYYVTLKALGEVYNWTLSGSVGTASIMEIGEEWDSKTALLKQATITLARYYADTEFQKLTDDDWVLLKLYEDDNNGYWAKVLVSAFGETKSVGAVDDEPLTFEVSGPVARIV